ncbi:MAG: hypothetical protein JXA22_08725 [Candidatus Thermoplasmatota archaeon]|nr:hypothetical protein [Candidatus Thermoplasmatota archaeon]
MSQDDRSVNFQRIAEFKERIEELAKKGVDTSRLSEILDNLGSTLSSVKDEEKIETALEKYDILLLKIESKNKNAIKKTRTNRTADEARQPASVEPEKKLMEPKEPSAPKADEAIPAAPAGEEASSDVKVVGLVSVEEPGPPGGPSSTFDLERADEETRRIDEMAHDILEMGGDISPIQPHMDMMKKARAKEDEGVFTSYLGTSRDWMEKYLFSLLKAEIESTTGTINVLMEDFNRVGGSERVHDLGTELSECLEEQKDLDLEGLKGVRSSLILILEKMQEAHKKLTEDLTRDINSSISDVETMIQEISVEVDTSSLREELEEVRGLLFNGQIIEAKIKSMELVERGDAERSGKETGKLESLLLSIGPLLLEIETSLGSGSRVFQDLKEEEGSIIELARTDPDKALRSMETFLDRVSQEAANIEEEAIKGTRSRISQIRSEAGELVDNIDISPILHILEKADDMVLDGDTEGAERMVEKAEVALTRLKERNGYEIASNRIEEIKEQMSMMEKKGFDITPLEGPLREASGSLEERDLELFEKHLLIVEQRLVHISNEELKVDYQKKLIKIMNHMKELRGEGHEIGAFETQLEKMKALYLDRKYEEAVKAAQELLEVIGSRRLYKVINQRKQMVEEAIREADGLLVNIISPAEKLEKASRLICSNEHQKALDLLIEAQVELEEKMTRRTFSLIETEIRDLAEKCSTHEMDVGNVEEMISSAYSLADEGNLKEGLDLLNGFRESLSSKAADLKVNEMMEQMTELIRQGRSLGMEVSQYKTILTKANVLMSAGDVEGTNELLSRVIENFSSKVSERRVLRTRLDKLRGNLLAQKGKLSRLERSGMPVASFNERVRRIGAMIDDLDHQNAEKELFKLDREINELLTRSPDQLKKEMVATIMDENEPRPSNVDQMATFDQSRKEAVSEADRARTELFTLIPKIKVEIMRLHSKGRDTDEYRKDIEKVQNLVIQKQYIKAFELAKDCHNRMTL